MSNINSNQRPNLLGAAQTELRGLKGTIRHLLYDRGFGFIEGDDGYDYFFHWTAVNRKCRQFRNIHEGEKVSFDIEDSPSGKGYRVVSNSLMIL